MNRQKRIAIYTRLQERDPSPSTELDWIDPFELLVAVVLSAQATDVSVNKATAELVPGGQHSRRRSFASAPPGSSATSAPSACSTARPTTSSKPAVSSSTSTTARSLAPGRPWKSSPAWAGRPPTSSSTPPSASPPSPWTRTSSASPTARAWPRGRTPLEVETRLTRFTPPEFRKDAHHWLILHGRYVCKARKPECPTCVIADLCEFREEDARTITFVTRPPRLGDNAVALEVLTPSFRHSRESGNPGGVGRRHRNRSAHHPAWIPAFAGMTSSGVCASLGWRFDTACFAGMTEGEGMTEGAD